MIAANLLFTGEERFELHLLHGLDAGLAAAGMSRGDLGKHRLIGEAFKRRLHHGTLALRAELVERLHIGQEVLPDLADRLGHRRALVG